MNKNYDWTIFYQEFANKLLEFKNNRDVLIKKIFTAWDNCVKIMPNFDLKKPFLGENKEEIDIDPFSVFSLFNMGLTPKKNNAILTSFKDEFSIKSEVPTGFNGRPLIPKTNYRFYRFQRDGNEKNDIDNLWEIFEVALKYADNNDKKNYLDFIVLFNKIRKQYGIKWNITMGLFWIRPFFYINLDGRNRWFLKYPQNGINDEKIANKIKNWNDDVPSAEEYLSLCESVNKKLETNQTNFKTLPEFSYKSYLVSQEDNVLEKEYTCWAYAPGEKANKWDIFYENGIMAIGWSYVGDLNQYNEEDKDKITEIIVNKENLKRKDNKGAEQLLIFSKKMKKGDWIFVKEGNKKIVGFGIVVSDYYYNENNDSEYFHCRKVNWLKKGDWTLKYPFKGQFTLKNLKGDTRNECMYLLGINMDYVENLKNPMDIYNKDEGGQDMYDSLKRNLIYFGAPGTGKSFVLNQDKDKFFSNENNFTRVTFHPDYSYANFVGVYKPVPSFNEESKEIISYKYVPGPFMRTLVKALKQPEENYLLIIEEINRANVAAVFGEVFQLLDRKKDNSSRYPIDTSVEMKKYLEDKLGKTYDKIQIPSNMYIWATMNSADQGVFPMDTAFKRRWNFKYFGIDKYEEKIENIKFIVNNVEISWNTLRKQINKELLSDEYKINEDKLLGPFFAFDEYKNTEISEDDEEDINDIFKNKIIMYLFEDAARSKRNELFSGVPSEGNLTYSQVCDAFDKIGVGIFCDNIRSKFIHEDGE